jgi:hypothetical protein
LPRKARPCRENKVPVENLERAFYPQARYGELFDALNERHVRHIAVVENGMTMAGEADYAPQLRFYTLLWRQRGLVIDRLHAVPKAWGTMSSAMAVASCDPEVSKLLISSAGMAVGQTECAARVGDAG